MKTLNFLSKTRWLLVPLMLLTFSVGQMWGADVTYTFQDHYSSNTTLDNVDVSLDSYTSATFNKRNGGTATQYYTNGNAVRWYGGGTLAISSSKTITKIEITFTQTANSVSASVGSYSLSNSVGTWTGSASSVTFTQSGTSGHCRISTIAVTYASSKTLSSISVQTAPTKTTYTEGEYFAPAGLVITRNYSDNTHDTYTYANHTSEFSFTPSTSTALTTGNSSVTIGYGGKSTSQAITVNASGGGGSGDDGTLVITRSCFPAGALAYNTTDNWSATASTGETVSGQGDLYSTANQTTLQTKNTGVSTHYHNTSALPGALKGISVDVASGTDRTYTVYASTNPITSIGSLTSIGSVNGGSALTGIDTSKGYKYFWMNCGGGASMLNNITITYVAPEESECTKEPTVSFATASPEAIVAGNNYTNLASVQYNSSATGQTITYTSSDPTVASVNASTGQVTANKAGTVTITATAAASGDYCVASNTYSLTINPAPDSQTSKTIDLKKDETAEASAEKLQWNGTYVTVVVNQNTSTTAANNYCPPSQNSTRFYTNSTLTFTPVAGYKIDNIVFTAMSDSYATALANSTWTNATAVASSTTVTVTASGSGAVSATIGGTCGFSQIVINYHQLASYAVTVTNPGHGTITVKDGSSNIGATVQEGKTLTVSGSSTSSAYAFGTISAYKTGEPGTTVTITNGELTMPAYPITITANETALLAVNLAIVAKDKNDNVLSGAQGNVATIDGGAGPVYKANNGTITLAETPASDYEFIGWSATNGITINGSTATVTAAGTITATFKEIANPTVATNPTSVSFTSVKKGAAVPEAKTFTITGSNLTTDLSLSESIEADFYTWAVTSGNLNRDANNAVSATVTVTPKSTITASAGDKNATITISGGGASNVNVNVTFNVQETYTAKWYVNGAEQLGSTITDVAETELTFPANPSATGDCEGLTFQGWKVGAIEGTAASEPSYVNPENATMPVNGVNYYAVFADGSSGDETESVTWGDRYDEQTDVEGQELAIGASAKVTFNKGTNSNKCQYYTTGSAIRVYGGGNFVVSAPGTITSITLTFGTGDNNNAITANVGTYSNGTWEGEANSVTFSIGGTSNHRRIAGISVTYSASSLFGWVTTCPQCNKVTLQKVIEGEGAEAAGNAIAFSPASTTVKTCEAAEVTVSPTIATGWELKSVAVNGVAGVTYNAEVISIPQDKEGTLTVTATFSPIDYSVVLEQSPAVGATLSGATDEAHYGATINLSATNIPANAQFVNWTSSDVTITNPTSATEASFTMPAKDVTVTANFLEIHNVAWATDNTPASGKSDFVYVKGIVTGITEISTEHGNATYYISDLDENGAAANSYLVFRAKKEGNTDYTSNTQLKEGDEVIVYGKLTNYQGTKEFDQGGYIITNGRTAATFDVVVSGTATKTGYYLNETFAYVGLIAKAEYSTGYKKNVTNDNTTIWRANNVASLTVTEAGTVNVTATWNETTSENFPVTVTVTTKVLESIEVVPVALTGYKGQALPKPTTVTAHFDDQGAKSTEPVAAFAIYDEANVYDASSTNAQTIQVKYSFGLNTRTADYTVTLSPVRNTLETAYTVAKGIEIIDVDRVEGNNLALDESANKAFVTGLVTAISSNKYTIKDNAADEAFIEIYEGTLGDGISSVVVGDLIKVEGNLFFFENNTHTVQKYQIMNGEIVKVARTPEFSIDDVAEMEVNITADLAEDDLTIERGGSEGAITFSCSDPAVTIVDNKLHAAQAGDATVTATIAASGEGAMSYGEATAYFNVHVIAERQRYAVNFDADGGSGDAPVVANQLPGVPVDLPANTFTKTDMRFTGWVVTNNSTSEVIAQEDGHFTMPAAAVTLTAQWVAKSYCALTLRINGVDQTPFDVERLEANDLSEHNPEAINGYDFYGWAALNSDVEDEVTEAIATLPNHIFTPAANEASKTLYAVFMKAESGENQHYILDYTDDHLADVSFSYNEAADVTATDGSEWVIKASKQQSMQINNGKDAYIKVPDCPANIVKILLSCRSGATAAAAFSTTSDGAAIVTATGSTTQTLNFSEVHVSAGYIIPYDGNCQITHIDVEYSGNFAYYTTRPVVRYTVTYDANGGSNAPAQAKTDVNGKVVISSAIPTAPQGKEFYCWNENAEGTGAIYWAGDKVSVSGEDVTIYATWRNQATKETITTVGGKFIINNLGDTAVFSRGNLQHQLSTNTWRAAEHQYDWAGVAANKQMGNPNYDGWVDLFSWSIGAENNYGATSAYHPSLYFNKEFVDWGGLFTGDWSTLSINEWYFMLYNRPNADNLWGMAMIGDTLGMVLLPGDWTNPSGVTFVPGTMPTTDMWEDADCLDPTQADKDHWRLNKANMPANKFTEEEWAILEEAGAVFCPYGGRRSGGYGNHTNRLDETVDYEYNYTYWENYYGAYWTSTVHNAAEGKVYWLPTICKNCDADHENWGRGTGGWWENGRYGHSVRLVHIIPRQYTVTYDANGGIGDVPVNKNTYLDGATVPVAAKGNLTKKGYAFAGWKFKGTTYKAGGTYTINNVRYNESIVFEAQWNAPSEYVLVTKETQLAAGDQIIIAAAGDYDYAMGTQNSGNYRNRVEIAKTEDKKQICLVETPVVFTLGITNDSKYTFYKEGEGYLCATTGNNKIGTEAELDDNGKWAISVTTDNNGVVKASVVAQGSLTNNTLQYNSGATRFSCYSSASLQAVALYKIPGNVVVDNKDIVTEDIAQNSTVTLDHGTMTVNEDKELSDLTLGLHAVVDVQENKTLETKDLTIKSTAGESTQMTGVVENVTYSNFYLEINFYKSAETLDETLANQWYMISAPFDVALNGGFFQTDGTPMVFGQDFDLFEYDGKKRADTGTTGWERARGVMHGGHACLIGFNPGQSTTIRLKAATTELANPTSITLNEYAGDAANSNWNGVANPTMRHIDFSRDVQTYDNDARGYQPYSSESNSFVVGRAFFVHGTGTVDLSEATHPAYAPRRDAAEKKYEYCVRLASENSNWANQMYVRASEEASASYEAGHDLETMNGTSGINALLWTNNYGMRLAIEEAPLVNDKASYELGIFAPAEGAYRIEANDTYDNANLFLTYNGKAIWNLSMSACEVELTKGLNEGYGLRLVAKMPQTPTGIEEVTGDGLQVTGAQKIVLEDKVFILRGGKMYDVTGKAVR